MPRTLITGMSATGTSSTVGELVALGYRAIDLDTHAWSHYVPDDSEYADPSADNPLDWQWRHDKVRDLLAGATDLLFVAGTSTYQGHLYHLLDHVVLLTVPDDVAIVRLAERTTNDYGKEAAALERELELRPAVEPMLRSKACLEIDTSLHAVAEVAALVTNHARTARC